MNAADSSARAEPMGRVLDVVGLASFASAVLLLAGSLLVAAGQFERYADGDDKLRLVGNAANPLTAALLLTAGVLAVGAGRRLAWLVTAAAAVAFLAGLLVLNGVVLDLIQPGNAALRLGSLVLRLGSLALCAATVWLWFAGSGAQAASKAVAPTLAPPQVIEREPLADDEA